MRQNTTSQHLKRDRWLRRLHLILAGIFGLVLPFVCWGAEATPGHPHVRAHFVFLAPAHHAAHPPSGAQNAHDVIRETTATLVNGVSDLCAMPLGSAESTTPATQSTPLVLVVTLLLLLALMSALVALSRRDGAGFLQRTSTLFQFAPSLAVATPPPRFSTPL